MKLQSNCIKCERAPFEERRHWASELKWSAMGALIHFASINMKCVSKSTKEKKHLVATKVLSELHMAMHENWIWTFTVVKSPTKVSKTHWNGYMGSANAPTCGQCCYLRPSWKCAVSASIGKGEIRCYAWWSMQTGHSGSVVSSDFKIK